MRLNTIQLAIPDELRGRVTAVNFVFINASNQIGGLESGVVASLTSADVRRRQRRLRLPGCRGLVAWRIPELRNHQAQARGQMPT